jgi:hypothetical protein
MVDDRPVRDTHRAAVVRPPDRPVTQRSMRCLGEDTGILFSRSNDGAPLHPITPPHRPPPLSAQRRSEVGLRSGRVRVERARSLPPPRRHGGTH